MCSIAFAWISDGRRPAVAWMAVLCLVAAVAPAAQHERGRVSTSLGGSVSQTRNKETRKQDATQYVYDDYTVELPATEESDSYTDVDLSLFLSGGYFVLNRTEVGLLGSTMLTQYSGSDREDFSLYDGQLYGKYFFDNATPLTPFIKLQGGVSYLNSGDYNEANRIAGVVFGLEYYGMGPLACFMEVSSQYTELGGDREGYEWRNQLYLGVSLYLDLRKKAREAEETAARPLQNLPPDIRRWVMQADSEWEGALEQVDEATRRPGADTAAPGSAP
ncbi:MAG: hypothetical protein K8T26_02525 [Lentisphaerae bacterium]|nr:hypothetical protein [Lentisphaerota bacterium]